MRILYDGQIYSRQSAGGASRWFARLIDGLPADWVPVVTCAARDSLQFPSHPRLDVRYWKRYGFRPGRVSYWLEQHYFRRAEARARPDVAHPTYYMLLTRRPVAAYPCPVVITVHDMIHEIFGDRIDPGGLVAAAKREAVLAAQAVIVNSESTRRDLLERLPVEEERVFVTPLAPGIDPALAEGDAAVPDRPYFVCLGSRAASYKNFDGLLRAFALARGREPDLVLAVVGAPFDDAERELVSESGLAAAVDHRGRLPDADLAVLLRRSLGLVYPSLYEGFGIPLLEAMTCGAPVVTSRASALPEVAGDAALLVDPRDPEELADALARLASDGELRADLVRRGRARAAGFSWQRTVDLTTDVYRSLASRSTNSRSPSSSSHSPTTS